MAKQVTAPVPTVHAQGLGHTVRFGRKEPTQEMRGRCLPLSRYLHPSLMAAPPLEVDYSKNAKGALARMYVNDALGCCVVSDFAHGVAVWSGTDAEGPAVEFTDAEIRRAYQDWCGPGDNGCYMMEAMDRFKRDGLRGPSGAQRIDGYVTLSPQDKPLVMWALWQFGGLSCGFNCYQSHVDAVRDNFVWGRAAGRHLGGHAVRLFGYNGVGVLVSTWGKTGVWQWAEFMRSGIVDELFAMVAPSWYGSDGRDVNGIDAKRLQEDLAIVGGGDIPPTPIPPVPTPPVPGVGQVILDGWVESFGQKLPVHLEGQLRMALAMSGAANWFVIARDVFRIVNAVMAKDWAEVAAAVEQLLIDLGVTFTASDVEAFTDAMRTQFEPPRM